MEMDQSTVYNNSSIDLGFKGWNVAMATPYLPAVGSFRNSSATYHTNPTERSE
jgi:hypothetical protein